MTHKDIYTKFMIEYDKANVTSSYPSLTEYEVATVLDKAYNALIAQKVTGNNARRVALEGDLKAVTDIAPLIINKPATYNVQDELTIAQNVKSLQLEDDNLYFLACHLKYTMLSMPMDGKQSRMVPTQLVSHQMASKFFSTSYNLPWVKVPVCYIENNKLYIVYDPMNMPVFTPTLIYIKTPNAFAKDLDKVLGDERLSKASYFDCKDLNDNSAVEIIPAYQFECNDTVAEELISLAVAFALENVESQRLNSKLNMRGLEA